tara:strand:- start:838 stop:1515 length:678 start_codon:yes stop_codon:yes gene_type:complete
LAEDARDVFPIARQETDVLRVHTFDHNVEFNFDVINEENIEQLYIKNVGHTDLLSQGYNLNRMCYQCLDKFGKYSQLAKTVSELSELNNALFEVAFKQAAVKDRMFELACEVVDVRIMLKQLSYMLEVDYIDLNKNFSHVKDVRTLNPDKCLLWSKDLLRCQLSLVHIINNWHDTSLDPEANMSRLAYVFELASAAVGKISNCIPSDLFDKAVVKKARKFTKYLE